MQGGAHNDVERTKAECWKKISAESKQNREQIETEHSRKNVWIKTEFYEHWNWKPMNVNFFVLHSLRLEKHSLTFSSENAIFQQPKT